MGVACCLEDFVNSCRYLSNVTCIIVCRRLLSSLWFLTTMATQEHGHQDIRVVNFVRVTHHP